LLGFLRPYRVRLAAALGCMVVYAGASALSLGLVGPFMKVLFESGTAPHAAASATPGAAPADASGAPGKRGASPAAGAGRRRQGWPAPLKRWFEAPLVNARPVVALERVCLFILIVLFLKNLADYLQAFLMVSVEQAAIRDLRSRVY